VRNLNVTLKTLLTCIDLQEADLMEKRRVKRRGQSLILVAFAIFALIAFVGLGIDLGMSYIARVRIRRAVDAASLAAASELPLERIAHIRALEYLAENQYDCDLEVDGNMDPTCNASDVRVEINTSDVITNGRRSAYYYLNGPGAGEAEYVIQIDTSEYADVQGGTKQLDSATRIQVGINENVELYFMKIFGFNSVPIHASAVAENISDLDVVLVFDESGSMEFDTRCYGCWTATDGKDYPDGTYWFLPWDDDDNDGVPEHCEGSAPYEEGGDKYIVIEAEDYSRLSNAYQRDMMEIGQTFWVLGRNGTQANGWMDNKSEDNLGRDEYGAYISHGPARTHIEADGYGVPCNWNDLHNGYYCSDSDWVKSQGGPFAAPRVDYDFSIPDDEGGDWYIWVRAKGGGSQDKSNDAHWFFWGMSDEGSLFGNHEIKGRENYLDSDGSYQNGAGHAHEACVEKECLQRDNDDKCTKWGDCIRWEWRDVWGWYLLGTGKDDNDGPVNLNPGNYTLHLWAGTPGVDIDRIVITTYDAVSSCHEGSEFGCDSLSADFTTILEDQSAAVFDNNRTGWACDPCDARYGGRPNPEADAEGVPECRQSAPDSDPAHGESPQPYRYLDDLYDDEQPIRASVEAAKAFVRKLNPRFDQIGLVTYNSRAHLKSELQCVRANGRENCTMEDFEETVIEDLENTHAGGGTNIAEGIKDGIDVLSNRDGHYGRPGAAHIMILMTDGEANQTNGLDKPACYEEELWDGNNAKDCVIYYAREARNNGIVIYTITLGDGADAELMSHVAEMTGGIHRDAPSVEQLGPIFDELYSRIFLRIVE
jgi:hypothetical protein